MEKKPTKRTKKSQQTIFFETDIEEANIVLKKELDRLLNAAAYTNPAEAYTATLKSINQQPNETPVTQKQWEKLYDAARSIRLLSPWEYLHESERITLLFPDRDEPVYIVVMGNGDMTYGIGIYPGYDSLNRMQRMTESDSEENSLSIAFEQHCINLYFGDRDELETADRNVIKKLGLKFRGRNEWPYFRSMKPGFMPWFLNGEEADLVIAALQNCAMACAAYAKQDFNVAFEEGETLIRFYDSEKDLWYNTAVKMPPEPFIQPKLIITDDILTAQLKKKKKNRTNIGLLITYLPFPVENNKNKRPIIPKVALLIDIGSGNIIDHSYTTDVENQFMGQAVIDMLTHYITEHGRPLSIAVNNDDTGDYIEDIAQKLSIKVVKDPDVLSVENLMMGLMEMMASGQLIDFTDGPLFPTND